MEGMTPKPLEPGDEVTLQPDAAKSLMGFMHQLGHTMVLWESIHETNPGAAHALQPVLGLALDTLHGWMLDWVPGFTDGLVLALEDAQFRRYMTERITPTRYRVLGVEDLFEVMEEHPKLRIYLFRRDTRERYERWKELRDAGIV